ncbi:hypothetical protein CANARDRAFT_7696 [[Candida] arabinofermentans NRRL YB-2248]|uniref:Uncharacterized protein n=1 Tax=[Candida] arabinofermentans NRRL YB-2248 TaxID=983967 RepID=A0A1E4T1F1_9ASCO|nr:hypothetical protein CANARDRAFT_7696 [[Candida] arabinofermentans NRRL YB-2248]
MLLSLKPNTISILKRTRTLGSVRYSSTTSTSAETIEVSSSSATQQSQEVEESAFNNSTQSQKGLLIATPTSPINEYENLNFAAYSKPMKIKTKYINTLPKVPSTSNIQKNELMLDTLFSSYQPLLQPIKQNHTKLPISVSLSLPPKRFKKEKLRSSLQSSSILNDLESYKRIKAENSKENYNPYFSKSKKFTPICSIFTNSALNTQQHNLELFNLPLSYIESLKPFQCSNKPGSENYRDDMIYIRKLEIEEKNLAQKKLNKLKSESDLQLAKKGLKKLNIDNFEDKIGRLKEYFFKSKEILRFKRKIVSNGGSTTLSKKLSSTVTHSHTQGDYDDEFYDSYDSNDNDNDDDNYEEEYTFEFDFSKELIQKFDPIKLHSAIFKFLQIVNPKSDTPEVQDRLWKLFSTLATLCDPYTQPSDTGEMNEYILSIDLVSDLVIALDYQIYENSEDTKFPLFDMALDLGLIIEKCLKALNCYDYNQLRNVDNDEVNWIDNLKKWIPCDTLSNITNMATGFHNLRLLYSICSVSVLVIYKLYNRGSSILSLNPFLSFLIKIWKNQTHVILLGLGIDRRDEELNFPGYPEVIRYVIKGASALRSITAMILNGDFKARLHDLKHESLNNFMNPWGRKCGSGALSIDLRIYVAAMISLGVEIDDVTALLDGLEPDDRYDEDIKYMFEMELEMDGVEYDEYHNHHSRSSVYYDHHHNLHKYQQNPDLDDGDKRKIVPVDEEGNCLYAEDEEQEEEDREEESIFERHPDCQCVFDDDEDDDDQDDDEDEYEYEELEEDDEIALDGVNEADRSSKSTNNRGLLAVRSSLAKNIQFDSDGRDWRDMPRGTNTELSSDFVQLLKESQDDPEVFITSMDLLVAEIYSMTKETISDKMGEKIIRSVAWVVRYDFEASLMSNDEREERSNNPDINPDEIYSCMADSQNFDNMIRFNPSISFCIIDELFMAEGYRRVLIWFLTHMELSQWLINYFHELLVGLRGNPVDSKDPKSTRFNFSRVGALLLSDVEKSMLLHEFFSNAVVYLSKGTSYDQDGNEVDDETLVEVEGDSRPITNRANAQKMMKIICLMLKSLESKGVLRVNDPEYRIEIQTLLVQWVGAGLVPEAKELFFKSSQVDEKDRELSYLELEELKLEKMFNEIGELDFFKIFAINFEKGSAEFLMMLLNLGNFYLRKRAEILQFFKDLNNVDKEFKGSQLVKICDCLFKSLHFYLGTNKIDKVLLTLKRFKLIDDVSDPFVNDTVNRYINDLGMDIFPRREQSEITNADNGEEKEDEEEELEDEIKPSAALEDKKKSKKLKKKGRKV